MFEKIIKLAEKEGLTAKEYSLSSGYFYNGKDNEYIYPCIVFVSDREITGKELSNNLTIIENIAKRHKLKKIDNKILPGYYCFRYTTANCAEMAAQAYSKAVRFMEGFWNKRHNNKSATQDELIAAGNENLVKHGYTI